MAEKTGYSQNDQQHVINLLTSILEEVKKQVQSRTPRRLEDEASAAVDRFRQIQDALRLRVPTGRSVS